MTYGWMSDDGHRWGVMNVENERWVGSKNAGQFVPRTLLPEIASSSSDFAAFASLAQAATV